MHFIVFSLFREERSSHLILNIHVLILLPEWKAISVVKPRVPFNKLEESTLLPGIVISPEAPPLLKEASFLVCTRVHPGICIQAVKAVSLAYCQPRSAGRVEVKARQCLGHSEEGCGVRACRGGKRSGQEGTGGCEATGPHLSHHTSMLETLAGRETAGCGLRNSGTELQPQAAHL